DIFDVLELKDENMEQQMMKSQTHDKVRKLVDLLPDEQREVVILRHYADMSFKEIANLTNVSINTALGRMRYALINIRKLIEERNIVLQ
nr:RNA polymerase subunit sigma-24 [Saprospiraceae bacterium]